MFFKEFKEFSKTIRDKKIAGLRIRIDLNPDPAFFLIADPDPDPGLMT